MNAGLFDILSTKFESALGLCSGCASSPTDARAARLLVD